MNDVSIRNINENDVSLLHRLAQLCPPLDVHTHYTYWVLCHFFNESGFVLCVNEKPVGYITSILTNDSVFIWQIGLLESTRACGYSKILIKAVADYAKKFNKKLEVSISSDNTASYNAFASFCRSESYSFSVSGDLKLFDCIDEHFFESEVIYEMKHQEESCP